MTWLDYAEVKDNRCWQSVTEKNDWERLGSCPKVHPKPTPSTLSPVVNVYTSQSPTIKVARHDMPRAAQHAQNAQRKRHRDGEDDDEEQNETHMRMQALPIADLPDDFDGDPEDGATYLAIVR